MIRVIDNLLSDAEADNLLFVAENRTNWQYFKRTARPGLTTTDISGDVWDPGHFQSKLKPEEGKDYISFGKIIYNAKKECLKGLDLTQGRTKINFTWRQPEQYSDWYVNPHVDNFDEHYVIVYYLHDSDGDTVIYNETQGWNNCTFGATNEKNISENLTVAQRVTPVRNRAVIFKGNHLHSVMSPIKSPHRMIVNINLMVK